jgi:hypothetical protein
MRKHETLEHIFIGAVAGIAATFALSTAKRAIEKRTPSAKVPMRKDAGAFVVERAESMLPRRAVARIPRKVESVAQQSARLLYGAGFGALYSLARTDAEGVLLEGAALGLAVWAAGYLGWLPATRLMPPLTRQRPPQILAPVLEHVLYGVSAVGAIRALEHQRAS